MKNKGIANFWIGFIVAAVATMWLYWLWRRNREVLPAPIIVNRRKESVSEKDLLKPQTQPRIELQSRKLQMEDPKVKKPDSLVKISGIGEIYEQRLNGAGIYTFEQLANSSPNTIQEITEVTRWNPEDWIAEAKILVDEKQADLANQE